MAVDSTIIQGDIGTQFTVTLVDSSNSGIDISSATGINDKFILFEKPDKTVLQKSASFTAANSGTDGILTYTAVSGDLDLAGAWNIQSWQALTDGSWYSVKNTFQVGTYIAAVTGI